MDTRNEPNQEKENLAGEVMESLTGDADAAEGLGENPGNDADATEGDRDDLPLFAKEKIGKLQKRHQRDLRRLQERIQMLETRAAPQSDNSSTNSAMNSYNGAPQGGNVGDEQIQRAVSLALQAKDAKEREAKQQQEQAHVAKQYQNLQNRLDRASDKYEDFDEVVMAPDAEYTPAMRDAMLMIDNPEDVLYKLGKDRNKLNQIAKLHPLDQAKEMLKLSAALMGGEKPAQTQPKTLGQVKSSPVNSSSRGITEKSSIREIRDRMKAGFR